MRWRAAQSTVRTRNVSRPICRLLDLLFQRHQARRRFSSSSAASSSCWRHRDKCRHVGRVDKCRNHTSRRSHPQLFAAAVGGHVSCMWRLLAVTTFGFCSDVRCMRSHCPMCSRSRKSRLQVSVVRQELPDDKVRRVAEVDGDHHDDDERNSIGGRSGRSSGNKRRRVRDSC